jgi:hypothetical protein
MYSLDYPVGTLMNSVDYPVGTLFKTTATHALFHKERDAEDFRLLPIDAKIETISAPCFIVSKRKLDVEYLVTMEIWQIIVKEKCLWILVHENIISKFFTKLSK